MFNQSWGVLSVKKCFLLLFSMISYFVHGDDFCEIEQDWADFQDKIEWFLQYRNTFNDLAFSTEATDDEVEHAAYLFEKWHEEEKDFINSLQSAHKVFFEFRNKVAEALAAELGFSRYAQELQRQTEVDLTKWYIEFMQTKLFPSSWQEHYKEKRKVEKTPPLILDGRLSEVGCRVVPAFFAHDLTSPKRKRA